MNVEKKTRVKQYLNRQINNADTILKGYAFNIDDTNSSTLFLNAQNEHPKRDCFEEIHQYLTTYLSNNNVSERIIILHGLRGTGKTTLLAQLYLCKEMSHIHKTKKLFLSFDEVVRDLNLSFRDVLDVYEEILQTHLEKLNEPVFLFLDEVHFDEKWESLLKIIYDKHKKVFVVATGSNALFLNESPDLARRAIYREIRPMLFREYMKITHQKQDDKHISNTIQNSIFNPENATAMFNALQDIEQPIQNYWADINEYEMDKYIEYGTFPFAVSLRNKKDRDDQIKRIVERIVAIDIPKIRDMKQEVLQKIPSILYILASSEKINTTSLSSDVGINRTTLNSVLQVLDKDKSGLVWRLRPYSGAHDAQVRKISRYLFASPAFRYSYFQLTESVEIERYKGLMFEDLVGMILQTHSNNQPNTSITYDSVAGGADFIIKQGTKHIIMEVGYGHKDIKQIRKTMKKTGIKNTNPIGVLISKNPLKLHEQHNIIEIPLEYFLLA